MNYVFFGNNVPLAERLRKALGTGVIECITLLQMKNTLLPAEEMDYCVFIEKTDPTLNIPAIMHLHKTFQNIYIVLIAPEMTREEKISYLQAGTDCVISESTSKEDLVKLLGIAEKCKRMEKARKPQIKEPDLAIFICRNRSLLQSYYWESIGSEWKRIYQKCHKWNSMDP